MSRVCARGMVCGEGFFEWAFLRYGPDAEEGRGGGALACPL